MNRGPQKENGKCRRGITLVIKCSLVILLNLQHYEVNMQILFQIYKVTRESELSYVITF